MIYDLHWRIRECSYPPPSTFRSEILLTIAHGSLPSFQISRLQGFGPWLEYPFCLGQNAFLDRQPTSRVSARHHLYEIFWHHYVFIDYAMQATLFPRSGRVFDWTFIVITQGYRAYRILSNCSSLLSILWFDHLDRRRGLGKIAAN